MPAEEHHQQLQALGRARYHRYYAKKHDAVVARSYARYLRRSGSRVTCEWGRSVKVVLYKAHLATAVHRARMAQPRYTAGAGRLAVVVEED